MKFFAQSTVSSRLDPNRSDSSNPSGLPPEPSAKETASIYGGVASEALPIPQTPAPSKTATPAPPKTAGANTSRWSPSLHTLLDQPPATLPQRLIIGGTVFCVAFGTWAWCGQIEEVGKAQGKLVPEGETYKIEPIDLGKVSHIAVEEGEAVKAGQVLVELDTELAQKEVERLEQMLAAYQIELAQKQALLERVHLEARTHQRISAAETLAQRSAIALAKEKAQIARRLLAQQRAEGAAYRTRLTRLKPLSALAQERLKQLRSEIVAHQKRIEKLRPLEQEGAVSQEFIFQAEQTLRQTRQQLTQSQLQEITNASEQLFQAQQSMRDLEARATQSQGELFSALKEAERLRAELSQKQAERRRIELEAQQKIQQLEVEITQMKAKIGETENLLVSAQAKLKHKFLQAPIDGIVLSLDLNNAGKVVQPGQTIAEIAPEGEQLVLSAVLSNKEAGFVEIGMPVQVKFDAYPYQDYGVISGKVLSISADAEPDEQLGEVYRVTVALERDYITDNQKPIKFKAGQTATAEIIIRRRRILEVFLDPIRRLQHDGIDL